MKKIIILILIFRVFFINAQNNGIIEYKYDRISDNSQDSIKSLIQQQASKFLLDVYAYAKQHKYILKFNNNESLFYKEEGLQSDEVEDPSTYRVSLLIFGKGIYYQNKLKRLQINQKETLHKLFRVRDTIKSDWILTYEKKTILGYKCYKAKKKCKCGKDIIVWYTPEIPLPFGPAGYNGAPGLILEVISFKDHLKAKKIILKKNKIEIQEPLEGKFITKKKLEALQWEYRLKAMQRRRK